MKHPVIVTTIVAALSSASAAETPMPKSLKCEFTSSVFHAWGEETKINSEELEMVFDSIDARAGTARLIGNVGTEDVTLVLTPDHLNFMEITPSGNINLTTVYRSLSELLAVHSRHVGDTKRPLLSQHYGTCRPYE